jgi:hypothetical protein
MEHKLNRIYVRFGDVIGEVGGKGEAEIRKCATNKKVNLWNRRMK